MMTVPEFKKRKTAKKKISMITCYDASFARIVNASAIDTILIGDSSAMVMHGFDSTLQADVGMIATHVAAVARTAKDKFIIADFPFLAIRKSLDFAVDASEKLMKAGAHSVKIEGIQGNEEKIRHLVDSGVPVMGHLGLTPQFINEFGGMKVQGKTETAAEEIIRDAKKFEECGAFALVLECIPSALAEEITAVLGIPTIGIGAGDACDGQVLVLQDMLGMNPGFKPKFLRTYLSGYELVLNALNQFHGDIATHEFPKKEESYFL